MFNMEIPSMSWISISVTISIFVVGHLGLTIWWASRVSTLLDYVQKDLKELVSELKTIKEMYVKKEDVGRELAILEKQNEAMWKKIDHIQDKLSLTNNGG